MFDPADVLSDALLIIIPCQLVYRTRLSWSQKIRVLSIFSASAITTVVCLVHSYYLFAESGITESVTAIVEVWLQLRLLFQHDREHDFIVSSDVCMLDCGEPQRRHRVLLSHWH